MIIAHSELGMGQGSTDSQKDAQILVFNEWDGSSCTTNMVPGKEYNSAAPPLGKYDAATRRSTSRPQWGAYQDHNFQIPSFAEFLLRSLQNTVKDHFSD